VRINFRKWLPVVIVALVVIVLVLIVRPLVATHQGSEAGTTSTSTVKSQLAKGVVPTSTATPSPIPTTQEEDYTPPITTCAERLGTAGFTGFQLTVEKYEALYEERATSTSYKGLATSSYIAEHSFVATPSPTTYSVVIDSANITCFAPTKSQLIVSIDPTISVYQTVNGTRTLANGPFAGPSHFSVWVQQGTHWLVNTEY
jgi:hypothetical protein